MKKRTESATVRLGWIMTDEGAHEAETYNRLFHLSLAMAWAEGFEEGISNGNPRSVLPEVRAEQRIEEMRKQAPWIDEVLEQMHPAKAPAQ